MPDPDLPGSQYRIKWWLIVLIVALGVACITFGWFVSDEMLLIWQGGAASYWSGVFVNVGSSLVLAAVLVWFERAIIQTVKKNTDSAVEDVATRVAKEAASEAARETTERLMPKIEEVDRLLAERQRQNLTEQSEAVATLGENASRDATFRLMDEATNLRAIHIPSNWEVGELVVAAGIGADSPPIWVRYSPGSQDASGSDESWLSLAAVAARRDDEFVFWDADMDAVSLFHELRRKMVQAGRGELASRLSVKSFFDNLRSGLDDAIVGREHADGAWLSGEPVYEVIADGWLITDRGLEVRGHGVVIERDEFAGFDRTSEREDNVGDPPEGLNSELWERAKEAGADHLHPFSF